MWDAPIERTTAASSRRELWRGRINFHFHHTYAYYNAHAASRGNKSYHIAHKGVRYALFTDTRNTQILRSVTETVNHRIFPITSSLATHILCTRPHTHTRTAPFSNVICYRRHSCRGPGWRMRTRCAVCGGRASLLTRKSKHISCIYNLIYMGAAHSCRVAARERALSRTSRAFRRGTHEGICLRHSANIYGQDAKGKAGNVTLWYTFYCSINFYRTRAKLRMTVIQLPKQALCKPSVESHL